MLRRLVATEWSITRPDWWSFGGLDRSFPMDIGSVRSMILDGSIDFLDWERRIRHMTSSDDRLMNNVHSRAGETGGMAISAHFYGIVRSG